MGLFMFRILKSIWHPIKLVKARQPAVFWTSLSIALLAGQAGIFLAFLIAIGRGIPILDVLTSNLSSANLYTFSISLLASAVVPLTVEYLDAEKAEKKIVLTDQKVIGSLIAFLIVIPAAGMAAVITADTLSTSMAGTIFKNGHVLGPGEWLQITIYTLSIITAAYLIAISRVHVYPDDLAEMTRQETRLRADTAHKMTTTSDGEEL